MFPLSNWADLPSYNPASANNGHGECHGASILRFRFWLGQSATQLVTTGSPVGHGYAGKQMPASQHWSCIISGPRPQIPFRVLEDIVYLRLFNDGCFLRAVPRHPFLSWLFAGFPALRTLVRQISRCSRQARTGDRIISAINISHTKIYIDI